ncbi:MAG: peptidoglycan editing factor PgeF [Syntrophobacterales bacterium]|jgi:YfiH family protein|nr:peptidoglycan editing factor PgeF [Syntrophobacterales bacterium]
MFHFLTSGTVVYLQSSLLAQFDFLSHGFCTRQGGVSSDPFSSLNVSAKEGDGEDNVSRNREIIAASFGFASPRLILANQVHGDIFHVPANLDFQGTGVFPECDAFMTRESGFVLGIKTADCVPVLLVDGKKKIISAIHAGWRGTALAIAAKGVREMQRQWGSHGEDIWAAIGPSIGPCCYEVDETTRREFIAAESGVDPFKPSKNKDRWMLDLISANRLQLQNEGVPPHQIDTADICTCCDGKRFFSYRRDGEQTGRHLNFITLREK